MKRLKNHTQLIDISRRILILHTLAILVATLGWWFLMEHTVTELIIAIVLAGAGLFMLAGTFDSSPTSMMARDSYMRARFVSMTASAERIRQNRDTRAQAFSDSVLFMIAGVLLAGMGGLAYLLVS